MRGISLTPGAMRFLCQALEGFRLVGARPLGLDGLRISGCVWSRHRAIGLSEVEDDKESDECEQNELIEKNTFQRI
jgi:hypothetical protein